MQNLNVGAAAYSRPGKLKPVFILKKHFLEIATGVTESFFDKQKCKYQTFNSIWNCEKREAGIFIDVHSIPDRHKYLPATETVLTRVKQIEAREAERQYTGGNLEHKIKEVQSFMYAAKQAHPMYYNRIKEKHPKLKTDKVSEYAAMWAVWEWIVPNYSRFVNCLEIFYAAYCRVIPGHFAGETSKVSFKNFHTKCVSNGIECTVIDQRSVNAVNDRRSVKQMALLQTLYIQSRKITAADAHRKIIMAAQEWNEKPMSNSNVKIIFREFENNAELFALRYGSAKAQKQLPFTSLLPADYRNDQWQMDGWTLPFWGAQFQRYILYLVRDNHSRKIVGYSIAESENTTLILDALENAMRETGVFPGEIVSDKHSFHKTEVAGRLRAETERMGAIWTVTINAQRNQLAERYNQYLDGLCKDYSGYLGKNLTATGKDARPAPEALTVLAKTANFKTVDEIKAIACNVVAGFNKMKLNPLEGLSPNEKYAASVDVNSYKISEATRCKLLRPERTAKVTRGQITVKVGIKKHEFQLPAHLTDRYNNRTVNYVHEDLAQGIYISDIATGEELGCIEPKIKIHGAIVNQTPDDKRRINQMTGRINGVTTKARKAAQAKITEGLHLNPEAIDLINTYALPKDVRQDALQNSEVRRAVREMGVNVDMMPIRTERAAAVSMQGAGGGKGRNTPFTPANNVMGFVSISELLEAEN